jgi:hypothetical protein
MATLQLDESSGSMCLTLGVIRAQSFENQTVIAQMLATSYNKGKTECLYRGDELFLVV